MLTRRSKKSQQNGYIPKMLTRRRKKSQQNGYMPKMLTREHEKSQQNSHMPKMLTRRRKKSQQNRYMPKMLTSQQKIILFYSYCYCKNPAELMNIRISGASECSIPFCDRGLFRMFISRLTSYTYKNVYNSTNNKNKLHSEKPQKQGLQSYSFSNGVFSYHIWTRCSHDELPG